MHSIKVKDYMTQQVVTFTPDMPLSLALDRVMKSHHMGGPVIDETEQVIDFYLSKILLEKLVMRVISVRTHTLWVTACTKRYCPCHLSYPLLSWLT